MSALARYYKQLFKSYQIKIYKNYYKFPTVFKRENIIDFMKSNPSLCDYIDCEEFVFYLSAVIDNRRFQRNRHALALYNGSHEFTLDRLKYIQKSL
jgi:hypothetical protein